MNRRVFRKGLVGLFCVTVALVALAADLAVSQDRSLTDDACKGSRPSLDSVEVGHYVDLVSNCLVMPVSARVKGPDGVVTDATVVFAVDSGAAGFWVEGQSGLTSEVTVSSDADGFAQAWLFLPVDFNATNLLSITADDGVDTVQARLAVSLDDYSGTGTLQINTNGIPGPYAVATRVRLLNWTELGGSGGLMSMMSGVAGFGSGDIFLSTELFLEPHGYSNDMVYLRLHNTHSGSLYQLMSKTDLTSPTWQFGEIITGNGGNVDFTPVPAEEDDSRYFGINTNAWLAIDFAPGSSNVAREPYSVSNDPGQTVTLRVTRTGITNAAITTNFNLTGSASYTNDYSLKQTNGTPLTNFTFTLAAGATNFDFVIQPVDDHANGPEFEESVVAVLNSNAQFAIVPARRYAQVFIQDNPPTNFFQFVTEIVNGIGIDYHPILDALIVSVTDPGSTPTNFFQVSANGTNTPVVTGWSDIANLPDELKLTVVKTTANGFTNGEMFFGIGYDGVVGKLSGDGTSNDLNWATFGSANGTTLIRGGLYVDQTGIFSNNLIVVTGDGTNKGGEVWQISATSNGTFSGAVLLAELTNNPRPQLEGVITLTNDVSRWGPWAGKIVTGAESAVDENINPRPVIYAIATNGLVSSHFLAIAPEDFDLIPESQDLYTATMEKVSRAFFTSYLGDLLITQAGDSLGISPPPPGVFVVHWDSTNSLFYSTAIPHTNGNLEHVTFAPLNLPSIP